MKKISLFPFLFLCLVAGFALIAMADETLFEDINASGYMKQGSSVSFFPATTAGISTNNSGVQVHLGTGLWNSVSSTGFWRFGRLGLQENVSDFRLGDTNIMNTTIQSWSISFPKSTLDDMQLVSQLGGRFKLTQGLNDTIMMTSNFFRFGITNEWITGTMGNNTLIINGRDGMNANSLIVSNYGSFFNGAQMVSSNFQQSAGSAGGFVGNGFGLTNLNAATGFSGILPIANGGTGTNTTQLTGNWTNTGNFTARGTLTGSNLVTTSGTVSVWNTGTNDQFQLVVNSGNGIATIFATNTYFTGLINAPSNSAAVAKSGTLFAINSLQTNNTGARQFFNVSVTLTPAVGDKAEARLFVFSPGATNLSAIVSEPPNTLGAFIHPMTAWLSPGDIGVVSNFSGATGTAVITNFMKTTL